MQRAIFPAPSICPPDCWRTKRLPPLGEVIVYGDGIDPQPVHRALAALADKPGIVAEPLQGGFAAWQGVEPARTTQARGLHRELLAEIDHAELARLVATEPDLVLVDLRDRDGRRTAGQGAFGIAPGPASEPASGPVAQSEGSSQAHRRVGGVVDIETPHRLTDLGERFPGTQRLQRKAGTGAWLRELDPDRLTVLIDRGDGSAERIARRLRSRGLHRIVILSGGEYALRADKAPPTLRKETTP
jgi:rhodanese-related sulfurtransferase